MVRFKAELGGLRGDRLFAPPRLEGPAHCTVGRCSAIAVERLSYSRLAELHDAAVWIGVKSVAERARSALSQRNEDTPQKRMYRDLRHAAVFQSPADTLRIAGQNNLADQQHGAFPFVDAFVKAQIYHAQGDYAAAKSWLARCQTLLPDQEIEMTDRITSLMDLAEEHAETDDYWKRRPIN